MFGFELNPFEGIFLIFAVFIFISTFSNFTFTFHIFTLTVLVLLSPFFLLLGCVRRNEEECLVCEYNPAGLWISSVDCGGMRKSVWVGSKTESRKSGAPVGRAAGGRSRLLLWLRSLEKNFYCFHRFRRIFFGAGNF